MSTLFYFLGKVDASLAPMSIRSNRSHAVNFCFPLHLTGGFGFLEKEWKQPVSFSVASILDWMVWLAILLFLLSCFFGVLKSQSIFRKASVLNILKSDLINIFLKAFSIFLNLGSMLNLRHDRPSLKFWICWIFLSFLVATIVKNEMQGALIAQKKYSPSLQELADSGVQLLVSIDPFYVKKIKHYWKNQFLPIAPSQAFTFKTITDVNKGKFILVHYWSYISEFTNSDIFLTYRLQKRKLKTYLTYRSFVTSKTLEKPTAIKFNEITKWLFQSGIYQHVCYAEMYYIAATKRKKKTCSAGIDENCEVKQAENESEDQFLRMPHLLPFLGIIAVVYVMDSFVFLVERKFFVF